jgi:thiol-disulfide isomerase/thioredoxin
LQRRISPFIFLALIASFFPLKGAKVPRPSPEYAIKLTTGRQLLLSSYRGKVVALMFVSTDCPHCADTCRFMENIQKEYGPKGFQTLAVAFNAMAIMLVPEFIKATGATYPVGYDERDPVFNYLERSISLRTYVPIMVFVDRKGVIRGQFMGDDPFMGDREKNIRSMIETLIREPGGASGR